MARRVIMFLLGITLGYWTGFQDARNYDETVVVRAVHTVQGVIRNTLGRRAEEIERTSERLERN